MPERGSDTGTFYLDQSIVYHYITKKPRSKVSRIKLLHDNAPAHRSALVKLIQRSREFSYILLIVLTSLLVTFD
jgi:hypothetical protein